MKHIEQIRKRLKAAGFTQGDLSEVIGRPQQVISEILNLKKSITPATARELEAALDIPASWLLKQQVDYQLSQAKCNFLTIREKSVNLQIKKGVERNA